MVVEFQYVTCSNPDCCNLVMVTKQQRHDLLVDNFLYYGTISFLYCSKTCRESHFTELTASKFFDKTKVKNRDKSLIKKETGTYTKRMKDENDFENKKTEAFYDVLRRISCKEKLTNADVIEKAVKICWPEMFKIGDYEFNVVALSQRLGIRRNALEKRCLKKAYPEYFTKKKEIKQDQKINQYVNLETGETVKVSECC